MYLCSNFKRKSKINYAIIVKRINNELLLFKTTTISKQSNDTIPSTPLTISTVVLAPTPSFSSFQQNVCP